MNFPSCPRPPNSSQLESSGLCFCTDLHRRQGHWTLRLYLVSIDHAANTELAARDRCQVPLDRTVTCSALPIQLFSPWLREVGVVERRPVRTSRDVMSRRSKRPQHHEALYFPHRRLWITEYSCKAQAPAQDHGGPPIMERFKRMTPPSFKGESDPLMA
ncbi:hypothetical protein Taro_001586 [Colocasia esculenta]|uniref:Uncharacterized protein n=1 Tax=Colocasia esculenta TaxID=4460 RepID=A0A843TAE9_COLES|nr:hypothetical protein [Colocasia esculenta]